MCLGNLLKVVSLCCSVRNRNIKQSTLYYIEFELRSFRGFLGRWRNVWVKFCYRYLRKIVNYYNSKFKISPKPKWSYTYYYSPVCLKYCEWYFPGKSLEQLYHLFHVVSCCFMSTIFLSKVITRSFYQLINALCHNISFWAFLFHGGMNKGFYEGYKELERNLW